MSVGEQVRNLRFQRAGIDDFAERRVGGQGQQITGDVEGTGAQGALVGILLHLSGLGRIVREVTPHALGKRLVVGK